MPNYCSNGLLVLGKTTELKRFLDAVETVNDQGFYNYSILHKLYPCPEELANTTSGWFGDEEKQAEQTAKEQTNLAKYGYKDWYDWCCAKWSTKWGDGDTYLIGQSEGHLSFSFSTAWSPPTNAFTHISTLFPTLGFLLDYEEQGNGFCGATAFYNGEVYDSYTEDIEFPPEPTNEGGAESDDEPDYWDLVNEAYLNAKDKCSLDADEWLKEVMG